MSAKQRFSIAELTSPDRSDPSAVALAHNGVVLRYGELETRSNQVANGLQALGLAADARVGFLGRNGSECIEVLLGSVKAGAVPTFYNWRLSATEVSVLLTDSGVAVLFVTAEFLPLAEAALAQGAQQPRLITIGEDAEREGGYQHWRSGQSEAEVPLSADDLDTAIQLYTSGTTGKPKGALLTHAGIAESIVDAGLFWGLSEHSRVLSVLPTFHIVGIGTALGTLWRGGTLLISDDAAASATLKCIERYGITHIMLASVMLEALVAEPAFPSTDLSSLELISYGAAPIRPAVLESLLASVACKLVQPYGLTETTGVLTLLDHEDHRALRDGEASAERLDSCGRARPGVEIRIVNPASGEDVADGEVGELWARSLRIMGGYWNNPEATDAALPGDGWFRTGDMACRDADGYITLRDRLNDLIISGGENVYPAEVEAVLCLHEGIREAAVVGVPSRRWGESPVAVVVAQEDADFSAEHLLAFVRDRIAHYKCPVQIICVDTLPRNATGKVQRKALRQRFADLQH